MTPRQIYLRERFYVSGTSPSGLRWKVRPLSHFSSVRDWKIFNKRFQHKRVGSINAAGYWVLLIDGKVLRLHRAVYELCYGDIPDAFEIDHIDGNPQNNSADNLRLATHSQNQQNRRKNKRIRVSKLKGVSKCGRKWHARIFKDKVRYSLGSFPTEEEAHEAYCEAGQKLHGDFFRRA